MIRSITPELRINLDRVVFYTFDPEEGTGLFTIRIHLDFGGVAPYVINITGQSASSTAKFDALVGAQ